MHSQAYFHQNRWANHRMIEACRNLSQEQLDATAPGTYGTIRETIVHIVRAETWYATLLGFDPKPALGRDDPFPDWETLGDVVDASAEALIAASRAGASELPDRVIVGPDDSEETDASVILVQAFNHGTEHRSQIATILTTLGVDAPDFSGWAWADDTGRLIQR